MAQEQQQWQQAEEYYQQALQIFREFDDNFNTIITLRNFARLWKDGHVDSVPKKVGAILGISEEQATDVLSQALQ